MQRYTREELLRASGARSDELADLEAKRLLLPNRAGGLFGRGEPYYTAAQLAVLRYLLRTRRSWEAARRVRPHNDPVTGATRNLTGGREGGRP